MSDVSLCFWKLYKGHELSLGVRHDHSNYAELHSVCSDVLIRTWDGISNLCGVCLGVDGVDACEEWGPYSLVVLACRLEAVGKKLLCEWCFPRFLFEAAS